METNKSRVGKLLICHQNPNAVSIGIITKDKAHDDTLFPISFQTIDLNGDFHLGQGERFLFPEEFYNETEAVIEFDCVGGDREEELIKFYENEWCLK